MNITLNFAKLGEKSFVSLSCRFHWGQNICMTDCDLGTERYIKLQSNLLYSTRTLDRKFKQLKLIQEWNNYELTDIH